MKNEHRDYMIFLLSTDWCRAFMESLLCISHDEYDNVINAARKEVLNILGTSPSKRVNYHYVNLSIHRIEKSWNNFLARLEKQGSSERTIRNINLLIKNSNVLDSDQMDMTIFWLILLDCHNEYIEHAQTVFPQSVLMQMKSCLQSILDHEGIEFEDLERASKTEWDMFLKTVWVEVPTVLSDFASIHFQLADDFKIFWVTFLHNQPREFKSDLLSWLVSRYELITESKATLPSWLIL